MTSHSDIEEGGVEALAFFRALLLVCGAGVIGWIILGALAFGIYELTR
jgi:hypothetical protein